jgi:hypothetical protein
MGNGNRDAITVGGKLPAFGGEPRIDALGVTVRTRRMHSGWDAVFGLAIQE